MTTTATTHRACRCDRVRIVDGGVEPFDPRADCGPCFTFHTVAELNAAGGGAGVLPIRKGEWYRPPAPRYVPGPGIGREGIALPILSPCDLEGPVREACLTCEGEARSVRTCYHDDNPTETCTRGVVSGVVWSCASCPHHTGRLKVAPPIPAFAARPSDQPAGVVLGFSRWPELIDLQLALIRATCGPVPVLVSADPDPLRPGDVPALAAVCARRGAELAVSPERIGHTGGDLAAFWRGVTWAHGRGLRTVAKLSQRFLITRPRWLQDGTTGLLLSALPAAARFADASGGEWGGQLRTEAMLLDVAVWNRPGVLARLAPRKRWADRPAGYHAEHQVADLIREELGGVYWPWALIPTQRYAAAEGLVWRMGNSRDDYDALARRFGVVLPADFKVGGWEDEDRKGEYDRG